MQKKSDSSAMTLSASQLAQDKSSKPVMKLSKKPKLTKKINVLEVKKKNKNKPLTKEDFLKPSARKKHGELDSTGDLSFKMTNSEEEMSTSDTIHFLHPRSSKAFFLF
ncbi:hypothetical protein AVEN_165869-1 [Araneus ventricosus]|uniref:Uncharacterized protein n=1 Tax=Araneus ventricosus TaxID=182803 RepID=A0A4Y2K5J6_ARAVE|nr:hypothetical protein AVEN_165869-1 [Araneus ventricosus]